MINKEELKPILIAAERDEDLKARSTIHHLLRPLKSDSVEEVQEKILIYIRLIYGASITFKDAPYHREIDKFYAEQIHSILNFGRPKYKGAIIVGFRESAKSTRVRFNEGYLTCYLEDTIDFTNVVSADGESSKQFVMDMFNAFALSKITRYFNKLIDAAADTLKKESKTMSKFTTKTGVTYAATSARQTKRGAVKQEVDPLTKEVTTKRPKKTILDDIENEATVRSYATTQHIKDVTDAAVDGMDQVFGFFILLGNVLSLRGLISYYLGKYRYEPSVKIIEIPIYYNSGEIAWPDKYCMTDEELKELAAEGIVKVSIESIKRSSDNFDTEYLNNPKRSKVYFDDELVEWIDETQLVEETERDDDGLLIIEEPLKGNVYAIGADTAKGVDRDQSAFVVYKVTGLVYEEVANFKDNKIKPEKFTPYTVSIAERYNHAFIVPENNYPGNEFVLIMKGIYNNYFVDENEEIGVHTNRKSKPEMFLNFKTILMDKLLRVRSRILYNQIMEYPSDEIENVKRDESGGHFDLLMSGVIGLFKVQVKQKTDDSAIHKILDTAIDNSFEENENNL